MRIPTTFFVGVIVHDSGALTLERIGATYTWLASSASIVKSPIEDAVIPQSAIA